MPFSELKKQNTMNHLIIMAGGSGSRFWPMSTADKPKQFVDVLGTGRTLIQHTADRFNSICSTDQIWVVTSMKYVNLVHEQLPEIPKENILSEPCMRNTAPCIAYAAWKIKSKDPDANVIIVPADHMITNESCFRELIIKGLSETETSRRIVTIGIKPHRPDTGYGYIKTGEKDQTEGFYTVSGFKEKPDKEVATHYVNNGGYYWNSGIFIWNIGTIENQIRRFCPELASVFDLISVQFDTPDEQKLIELYYPGLEKISIDNAVMEKSTDIYVIAGNFGWSDLGTWSSLFDLSDKDQRKNAVSGDNVRMIESDQCMVILPTGKQAVIEGLSGYIIIDHNDSLLICKKENEQHIRTWIES